MIRGGQGLDLELELEPDDHDDGVLGSELFSFLCCSFSFFLSHPGQVDCFHTSIISGTAQLLAQLVRLFGVLFPLLLFFLLLLVVLPRR